MIILLFTRLPGCAIAIGLLIRMEERKGMRWNGSGRWYLVLAVKGVRSEDHRLVCKTGLDWYHAILLMGECMAFYSLLLRYGEGISVISKNKLHAQLDGCIGVK